MGLKERLITLRKQEVPSEFSNLTGLHDLEDFNNSVLNELTKFIGANLVLQELIGKLNKIILEKTITKIERKIIQGILP